MSAAEPGVVRIAVVGGRDLAELLPLMRAYCDFYEVAPSDDALLSLSEALIADPEREGLQLIARNAAGTPIGFATLLWSWSTLHAARIGILYDLFVDPDARGGGIGRTLIEECRSRCEARGIGVLSWSTAPDNERAQALYDSLGAGRSTWLEYEIGTGG